MSEHNQKPKPGYLDHDCDTDPPDLATGHGTGRRLQDRRDPNVMIGAIVGHLRRAEGISQTGLGDRISLSRRRIQAYEEGAIPMELSVLQSIAEALNFDLRLFIEAVEDYQVLAADAPPER